MEDMGWQPGGGDKDFWDIMYKIETDGFNYKITCVVGFTAYLHNFYVTTGGVKNIIWADCFHHNGESVVVNGIGAGSLTFGANSTGKVQLNGNNITVTGLNTTAPIFTPIIESGSDTPGTDTLTLDARPTSDGDVNNSDYAGVMQDGSIRKLALVKNGTGELKLSGNNTYTGPTNVNGGTLLVNGTNTGGGTYTVASTATLGGTGTIGSPVIVQSGGYLAPGASVGTLHVGSLAVPGSVTMAEDSIYDWEFGDTSTDKVEIAGDLTLDPGWRLKLVDVGGTPQAGNQYDLFTFTGTFSGDFAGVIDASGVSWDTAYAVICLEDTPGGGRVYIANIPEPATLSLLALGGLVLIRRRRK
jgi:autotransporter-associated beta strand protein